MIELYDRKDHPSLETLKKDWVLLKKNLTEAEVAQGTHNAFTFSKFEPGQTVMFGGRIFFEGTKAPQVIRRADKTFQVWQKK